MFAKFLTRNNLAKTQLVRKCQDWFRHATVIARHLKVKHLFLSINHENTGSAAAEAARLPQGPVVI
jgi:hypothetical protein